MLELEWWPDHGGPPLWVREGRGGVRVDPAALGLDPDLVARLAAWGAAYDEDALPVDGEGDRGWVDAGVALLAETRRALEGRCSVVVTEPWWGEPPADPPPVGRGGPA